MYKHNIEEAIANPVRNVVLWFPYFSKIHLLKDPGQIPVYLSRMGYNVRILTYDDERNKNLSAADKVELVKLQKHGKLLQLVDIPLLCYVLKNRKNIGCMILYFANLRTTALLVILKLLNAKTLYIVKMDSDGRLYDNRAFKNRVFKLNLTRKVFRRIVGEITFRVLPFTANLMSIESPEARQRVLNIYPWLEHKLVVLPNGINRHWFDEMSRTVQADDDKTILFVGRVEHIKGPDLLIRAFSRLKDKYPDWKLELVGEIIPSFRAEMEHLISENLKDRVVLTGPLYGRDLVQKYMSASIFCLPSRIESFGIALVEAMYFNNAVISAETGAARYMLDYGDAGMIFDAGDIDQLTACLDRLIGDEILRKRLATAAKLRCEKLFDWESIMSQLDHHIFNMSKGVFV